MKYSILQEQMKYIRKSKNWKRLVNLIDDGYKGIFVILRIVSESDESVTAGDLAKEMNVSTARIASALNTLENKKYVKRESDAADARKVVIKTTADGEAALQKRKDEIKKMVSPMLDNLSDDEVKQLFAILNKMLK